MIRGCHMNYTYIYDEGKRGYYNLFSVRLERSNTT